MFLSFTSKSSISLNFFKALDLDWSSITIIVFIVIRPGREVILSSHMRLLRARVPNQAFSQIYEGINDPSRRPCIKSSSGVVQAIYHPFIHGFLRGFLGRRLDTGSI